MQPKTDPNAKIAETLAAPFSNGKGRGSAPLSFRLLPEGGMVVITNDGRKLWFSTEEVAAARENVVIKAPGQVSNQRQATSRFQPTGLLPKTQKSRTYNGMPVLTVLPPKRQPPKSGKGNP